MIGCGRPRVYSTSPKSTNFPPASPTMARASSHSVPPVKRPSTWPTRERPARGRAKPGRGRPSARTHPSAAASSVAAMTTPGGGVPCQPGR